MGKPTLELGRAKTGGRVKGTPNKVTTDVKAMILAALDDAGGRAYLARQAVENPGPFMTLVGRCLPKDIKADVSIDGDIKHDVILRPQLTKDEWIAAFGNKD